MYVAAFYDLERKGIGFVQYPGQVGDEVNSCVGVGGLSGVCGQDSMESDFPGPQG